MACRAREHEMSLALDGRLPSGARAALLRHVGRCVRCARVWQELHAARDLVLSLPGERPSPGFRETLRRRIESGEAAPECADPASVPALTKVRYLLTGAAAAAALLAALHFLLGERGGEAPRGDLAGIERVAPRVEPETAAMGGGVRPGQLAALPVPVSEAVLAQTCAERCARSAAALRARAQALDSDPAERWTELSEVVTELQAAVGVMRWLDAKEMVELPSTLKGELQEADHFLTRASQGPSWDARRSALQRVRELGLERVQDRLRIVCCREPEELACDLEDLVVRIPEAQRIFRFFGLEASGEVELAEPGKGRRILFLRVEVR